MEQNFNAEIILLVEDEEPLRNILVDLLTQCGFRVLGAANGKDALALVETHPAGVAVLITDVVMPELSGPELAEKLRRLHPNLKVIFVSGDTSGERLLVTGAVLLQKPFTISMLEGKVREVLAA